MNLFENKPGNYDTIPVTAFSYIKTFRKAFSPNTLLYVIHTPVQIQGARTGNAPDTGRLSLQVTPVTFTCITPSRGMILTLPAGTGCWGS